jgi:LysM repeat protein
MAERNYANRRNSPGPSATVYIDRDGTVVRAIDPARYAAWSQGDVNRPNIKVPTIAAIIESGVNANEWVYESIECSGAGPEPYTDAQFESVAQLVAAASRALGIPVNRSTVVVHADFNSVTRRSCPWPPATREARVKRVIARANAILRPPITTVTVKPGDTLSQIAAAHGLSLAALLAFAENARYRTNPGLIRPGDIVRVK